MTGRMSKPLRDWRQFAAQVAFGLCLGAAIPLIIKFASPAAAGLVVAAAMIAAGYLFCRFGGRLDEAMLEAVKWAWLWGGSAGLGIAAGVAVWGFGTASLTGAISFELTPQTAAAIGAGAVIVAGAQIVLHLVLWAYWWRTKR